MPPDLTCGKIVGQIVGQKLRIKNKLTSLALKKITQLGRYIFGVNDKIYKIGHITINIKRNWLE